MNNTLQWWTAEGWILFAFSLTRISGVVATSTWLGPRLMSMRTRFAFACILAWMMTSLHRTGFLPPTDAVHFGTACLREAILGVALGWSFWVLMVGFQLGGQLISQLSGLSFAEVWDVEAGGSLPLMTGWIQGLALTLFLLLGGHRQTLHALLRSFDWRPPGRADLSSDLLRGFAEIIGESFVLAIQVALPIAMTLVITTLVLGLIGRALPQLQLLTHGLPLNLLLMLVVLIFSLGGVAWLVERHLVDGTSMITGILPNPAMDRGNDLPLR
jgi:flagellar biosynthetic protein FliR